MFNFFKKSNASKKRAFAAKLDGRHIKYVTERRDGTDEVIGKEGALIIRDNCLLVYSSSDVVFRADIDTLDAAELMSLDGVVLEGEDIEHGGQFRKVIAYYTYYL